MENSKRETYIDFLKIVAIVLIINSHCDSLYPIKALATGGALGNSLFFICAGFLYGTDVTIKKLLLKICKLYIPTWLAVFCFYGIRGNIFFKYIWPTMFWFIGAIVLFYILLFILEKLDIYSHYRIFLCICCLIYFAYYIFLLDTSYWVIETEGLTSVEGCFKLIYYFVIMSIGVYFRRNGIPELRILTSSTLITLSVAVLYGTKYLFNVIPGFMRFQFINQGCVIAFAISMLCFFRKWKCVNTIKKEQIKKFAYYASQLSLEIYLVQFTAIKIAGMFCFPINIFIVFFLTAFMSIVLYVINWLIQRYAFGNIMNNSEKRG